MSDVDELTTEQTHGRWLAARLAVIAGWVLVSTGITGVLISLSDAFGMVLGLLLVAGGAALVRKFSAPGWLRPGVLIPAAVVLLFAVGALTVD